MGLTLTVLGCSGSYPGPGSACSSYLVRTAGTAVALDLGNGSLANLQRHLAFADLDAVVLSHAHPDHWVDLAGLRVALRYGLELEGLRLVATEGTVALARELCGELEPTFDVEVVADGDEAVVGDLHLRFAATDHYVPTLACRVDGPGGVSLAYSADTGPDWSFASLGPGIDLALCEATHLADEEGHGVKHLSARQAGVLAREAGIPRLLVTHLWPAVDRREAAEEAAEGFGGPVEVVAEHAVYDLRPTSPPPPPDRPTGAGV